MSIQEDNLKKIADAIREKEGSAGKIKASDFADRIKAISGGTGDDLPFGTGDIPELILYPSMSANEKINRIYWLSEEMLEDIRYIFEEAVIEIQMDDSFINSVHTFYKNGWTADGGITISNPQTGSEGIDAEQFGVLAENYDFLQKRFAILFGDHWFVRIDDKVYRAPVNGTQEEFLKFLLNVAGYETIDDAGYGEGSFMPGKTMIITLQIDVDRFFSVAVEIV